MSKLYKTTIVFEVLTDGLEVISTCDLGAIVTETIEGHASGEVKSLDTEEVSPEQMSTLLTAQMSDPNFFVNDWEEEEEEQPLKTKD